MHKHIYKFILFVISLLAINSVGLGQEETKSLNTYTPSVLLSEGQFEVKLYNNLYTQMDYFNNDGEKVNTGRSSYMGNFIQVLYGGANNRNINWGFDINVRSVRLDSTNTSPFKIFQFENNDYSRTTIGFIGPKIKFAPFKNIEKLSVQSSFWIPVSKNMEGTPWLAWQKLTFWTQVFYDYKLSEKFNLFSEVDVLMRIKEKQSSTSHVMLPISSFLSYFPNSKSTVYVNAQYAPTISTDGYAYFAKAGVGAKLQLFPSFEIEVSASNFFAGKNQGAGGTIDFGLRYLK